MFKPRSNVGKKRASNGASKTVAKKKKVEKKETDEVDDFMQEIDGI